MAGMSSVPASAPTARLEHSPSSAMPHSRIGRSRSSTAPTRGFRWRGSVSLLRAPALPHRGMGDQRLTVLRRGLEATRFVQWMLEIQDRIWRQRLIIIALRALALICLAEIVVCGVAIRMQAQPDVAALVIPAA